MWNSACSRGLNEVDRGLGRESPQIGLQCSTPAHFYLPWE